MYGTRLLPDTRLPAGWHMYTVQTRSKRVSDMWDEEKCIGILKSCSTPSIRLSSVGKPSTAWH